MQASIRNDPDLITHTQHENHFKTIKIQGANKTYNKLVTIHPFASGIVGLSSIAFSVSMYMCISRSYNSDTPINRAIIPIFSPTKKKYSRKIQQLQCLHFLHLIVYHILLSCYISKSPFSGLIVPDSI